MSVVTLKKVDNKRQLIGGKYETNHFFDMLNYNMVNPV